MLNQSSSRLDKAMSPEQFNQVVEAIVSGKYSWACVLILQFAGYNPLHYIPYRTYVRVVKENCKSGKLKEEARRPQVPSTVRASSADSPKLSSLKDLSDSEEVNQRQIKLRGS